MNTSTLRSLYHVLEFNARAFIEAQTDLMAAEHLIGHSLGGEAYMPQEDLGKFLKFINDVSAQCIHLQLILSIDQIGRIKDAIRRPVKYGYLRSVLVELRNRMADELKGRVHLSVTRPDSDLYTARFPFGEDVASKFSRAASDISEAAKCLALERPTASVFHLMRVMELGVQNFGKRLGVASTSEKTWQKILDDLNASIKAMPAKTKMQKSKKERYAAAHAHLFSVKLAWRNPVMHPKATYTLEEAREIFGSVKTFTTYLITV